MVVGKVKTGGFSQVSSKITPNMIYCATVRQLPILKSEHSPSLLAHVRKKAPREGSE